MSSSSSAAESKEEEDVRANFKPGQKYPTPSPGNGDRVFYETLYQQRPDSEMAQDWVLAYGILSAKDAEKLLKKVSARGSAPAKQRGGAAPSKAEKASAPAAKRRRGGAKVLEDEDGGEDDAGVWEGQGSMGV